MTVGRRTAKNAENRVLRTISSMKDDDGDSTFRIPNAKRAGVWCKPGASRAEPNITPELQPELFSETVGADGSFAVIEAAYAGTQ